MINPNSVSILIVDDQPDSLFSLQYRVSILFKELDKQLINIKTASNIDEMRRLLDEESFHVILLDKDLGKDKNNEKVDGIEQIPHILEISPRSKILVITASDDINAAVKAMQYGAVGYVTKNPSDENQKYCNQQILNALRTAKVEMDLFSKNNSLDTSIGSYICKSKAMQNIDYKLRALASVNTSVLILGESGLGKTHAAKRLSNLSKEHHKQPNRPFVNVNINAIPKTLLESELFGSEKGSYTNAIERKQGYFEAAANGDLFLDEIGDAPLELQGALLKVIEEKHFRRIGGNVDIKMSARIIFATNKDLDLLVKKGDFRADLYARISVVQLLMPSLHERKEDVPYICQTITNDIQKENHQEFSFSDFPPHLKSHFSGDYIPFNIRGIRNELERIFIFSPLKPNGKRDYSSWRNILMRLEPEEKLSLRDFEPIEKQIRQLAERLATKDRLGLNEAINLLEKNTIEYVTQVARTNKKQAEILKLKESTLLLRKSKIFGPVVQENV